MMIENVYESEPNVSNVDVGGEICDYYLCGEIDLHGGFMFDFLWHKL